MKSRSNAAARFREMQFALLAAAIAVALNGCMSMGTVAAIDAAKERELERLVPTCLFSECDALMERARAWLEANTDFPIEHASSDYVTTARDQNQASRKVWGYVQRERLDDTMSRIPLTLRCNNPFSCARDTYELQRKFYESISGTKK